MLSALFSALFPAARVEIPVLALAQKAKSKKEEQVKLVAIQVKSPNFWLPNCDGGSTRRLVDESGSGCPRKRFHAVPALGRGVLDAV